MIGRIKAYLVAAAIFLIGIAAALFSARRQGAKDAEHDMESADYQRADDIRNRVDRDLADRVRNYDDAGWRE